MRASSLMACAGALFATTALSADVEYPVVTPHVSIELPRDEGSHPQFRTEWWYVTGTVQDEQGASFGFQVTFFRSRPGIDEANPSQFAAKQLLFAHVGISDMQRGKLLRDERSARAGFGIAYAKEGTLDVAIDDWSLGTNAHGTGYRAQVRSRDFQLELDYVPTQKALVHGVNGYSRKGPQAESASYYYTLPHLRTSGRLKVGGHEYRVQGTAWLDHEWSSSILDEQAQGWDWVGVNLDNGGALMAFQMRNARGGKHWAAATMRTDADGAPLVFAPSQVEWTAVRRWKSPRTGIDYPLEWEIRIGERMVVLRPRFVDQESDARSSTGTIYWEGAVTAFEADKRVGSGYLELTGYGRRVNLGGVDRQ